MDDTTRGVRPGDDLAGRGDDTTRNYAGEPDRSAARVTPPVRSNETGRTGTSASTTGSSAGTADLDPETNRRARELQSEIAHTRAEMSETIEALQEKLRPANLVSDVTDKVRSATTEKVKNMADTATDTAQGMMREGRDRAQGFMSSARQNPIPSLMIGAGVAWMLMDRNRKGNGHPHSHGEWPEYSTAGSSEYRGSEYDSDSDYGNRESGLRDYAASSTEALSSRAREAAGQARRTARRTQNGLQHMLHENPLLVAAAAMLAGAAVGASLPETERENELMGEARDSVVERAQEAAKDAAGTVREVANETVGDAVGKVARRVGSTDA